MTYRLSSAAQFDLFRIAFDGLDLFGARQVAKYETGLKHTLDVLAQYPRAAPERDEYSPPVRIHPFQAHVIVFRIEDNDDIFILRICHAREDWTRLEP